MELVLGDSVIFRHLLISGHLNSGHHLILTLPLIWKTKRNTGENERNNISKNLRIPRELP